MLGCEHDTPHAGNLPIQSLTGLKFLKLFRKVCRVTRCLLMNDEGEFV